MIFLEYDKAGIWLTVDDGKGGLNANPWIFINKNNQWYAATFEWLRPGQMAKQKRAVNGDHIKQSPFWNWSPKAGIVYGFMVSGLARDGRRNVKERTNIVFMEWK